MLQPLVLLLVGAGLLLALAAGVVTALDRRISRWLVLGAGVVEAVLVVQLVVGIVQLATTDRAVESVVFVAYLVGSMLALPAAVAWARAEPSRWGTGVLVVAALVVVVLVARLQQIWSGG